MDQNVRRGVAGYVGAGSMAWEATAEDWRRRRAAALVFGGLLWCVCCWCGGKRLSCRGENHSKRELPRDRKEVLQK